MRGSRQIGPQQLVPGQLGPGQLELVGPGAQLSGVPNADMRNEDMRILFLKKT